MRRIGMRVIRGRSPVVAFASLVGSATRSTTRRRRRPGAAVGLGVGIVGRARGADPAHQCTSPRRRTAARAGSAAAGRRLAEALLDDAVLARVVGEHGDAPAGREASMACVEGVGQHVELAVDLDADRLERALGRVAAGAAGRRRDGVATRSRPARPWSSIGRAATMARAMRPA